jgi:hypothetical protein
VDLMDRRHAPPEPAAVSPDEAHRPINPPDAAATERFELPVHADLTGDKRFRREKAAPILAEGWQAIEVDRLWIRGQSMRLAARQGERARLEPAG